jgi:hypothetical protein
MGAFDAWIVYKFLRTLTTPWDEMPAFRLGIIDATGKPLKKSEDLKTDEERSAYTVFNRLVFNLKRLIEKFPGGKSKIGTYAAALLLLREQMGDEEGVLVLEKAFMSYLKESSALAPTYLEEQYLPEELLPQGNYKLINTMMDKHGEMVSQGTIVVAKHNVHPTRVLGVDVYELQVAKTGKPVVVSNEDIQEV